MAQGQPSRRPGRTVDLARVGAVAQRAGLVVIAATLPLAVGSLVGLVADAPTVWAALAVAAGALDAAPTLGTGRAALFGLATLGVLSGCWSVGLGLVLAGRFG